MQLRFTVPHNAIEGIYRLEMTVNHLKCDASADLYVREQPFYGQP
jgi:hypothetical protein